MCFGVGIWRGVALGVAVSATVAEAIECGRDIVMRVVVRPVPLPGSQPTVPHAGHVWTGGAGKADADRRAEHRPVAPLTRAACGKQTKSFPIRRPPSVRASVHTARYRLPPWAMAGQNCS